GVGQVALDAQLFVAGQFDVAVLLDQFNDAHRVDRRVFLEGNVDYPRRRIDLYHAVGPGDHAQAMHVDEGLRLGRELAKAVHNFFQQGVDLVGVFGGGQLLVETQAQVHVAAVVVGQERRRVQVDLGGRVERRQQV